MATKKKDTTRKSLYLSDDKKLLGVAGGIAEYFDIDPAIVRIIALILIVCSGFVPGMIIYFIIGLFIMPEKNAKK